MGHLVKNVRIHRVFDGTGGAKPSSQINSRCVDMKGFEGVMMLAIGTSKTGGGAVKMTIQAAASTTATFYTMYGTSSTGTWTTGLEDYKLLVSDYYKPLSTQRYCRAAIFGSSTGDLGGVIAIQYGARSVGSSYVWKASTRAGSTLWQSTRLGSQALAVSSTAGGSTA